MRSHLRFNPPESDTEGPDSDPEEVPKTVSILEQRRYYTCDSGAESLSCTSVRDALLEHMESMELLRRGADPLQEPLQGTLVLMGPIEVYRHVTTPVEPVWVTGMALQLIETFSENFSEEFGDPDGGRDGLTKDLCEQFAEEKLSPLLQEFLARHGRVWSCELEATEVFTPEQVTSLLREDNVTRP